MAGGRKPGLWGLHPADIKDGTFARAESPLPGPLGTSANLRAAPLPSGMIYNEDVHRDLTRALALAAGFETDIANRIANANQGVDDNSKTSPMPNWRGAGIDRRALWHFTTAERQQKLEEWLKGSPTPERLGIFLHVYQDKYSHRDLGAISGQVGSSIDRQGKQRKKASDPSTWSFDRKEWDDADDTWRNVGMANRMARETYIILQNAKDLMFEKGILNVSYFNYDALPWERKLADLVWYFNMAREKSEKDKYIEQIVKMARDNMNKQFKDSTIMIK